MEPIYADIVEKTWQKIAGMSPQDASNTILILTSHKLYVIFLSKNKVNSKEG